MPLVVVCGYPCSGKSTRSKELKDYFEKSGDVVIIDDHSLQAQFDKNITYSDPAKEKELRSHLKSEVQKHISKDRLLILDSGNYVKGFRYEIYCICKSARTTSCVVQCVLTKEECLGLNGLLPECTQYDAHILEALVERFESPDSKNRWDSPLFRVFKDEKLPFTDIHAALYLNTAPPPNLSTQTQPLAPTTYLHELDTITQEIVKLIIQSQKSHTFGDSITIPSSREKIFLQSPVSAAKAARLRRQFINCMKVNPSVPIENIADTFVNYFNVNNKTL